MSNSLTEEQKHEYREAFAKFAKQPDNVINVQDLSKVMRSLGEEPTEAELQDVIQKTNNGIQGTMNCDEFIDYMKERTIAVYTDQDLREAFNIFDRDKDGFITTDEMFEVMSVLGEDLTPEDVESLVQLADLNNDGKLDFDEFTKFLGIKKS